MDIGSLDNQIQQDLLDTIEAVLDRRVHKRNHLGEEIIVKGSLSKALKIPELKRKLQRKNADAQVEAGNMLAELWLSLSATTQNTVLEETEWYDPKTLEWDDPRSNRKPPTY